MLLPNHIAIVPSELARDIRTEFKVVSWAANGKRRKAWRVLRVEINKPGCYRMGDTYFMHPELIAKLQMETK